MVFRFWETFPIVFGASERVSNGSTVRSSCHGCQVHRLFDAIRRVINWFLIFEVGYEWLLELGAVINICLALESASNGCSRRSRFHACPIQSKKCVLTLEKCCSRLWTGL